MTSRQRNPPGSLHLRLPATSANLGPGFDAVGLAMAIYLTIDAEIDEVFRIEASGRNSDLCGRLDGNLILTTYVDVLANAGIYAPPLSLRLHNEIPIGMGCGSSAAALAAGVMLADHFGGLGWTSRQILEEACRREGHPDNVSACLLGGMTVSCLGKKTVTTATCGQDLNWSILLAMPSAGLATAKARALLPARYARDAVVANLQASALLVAAFAQNRPELLQAAMLDRLHQPYREQACPLLPLLAPLPGTHSAIFGVALSGAGPAVLVLAEQGSSGSLAEVIRQAAADPALEVIETRISEGALSAENLTPTSATR